MHRQNLIANCPSYGPASRGYYSFYAGPVYTATRRSGANTSSWSRASGLAQPTISAGRRALQPGSLLI